MVSRRRPADSPVDQRDFDSLIEHYPRIRRAAMILSNGNAWDADDLAQETMLHAARGWQRFAGGSQVHTWLYSILLNRHRRRLRTKSRCWRSWLAWFERRPRSPEDTPDQRMENDEWRQTVWSAVAELPEAQKQAILLRYSEELTYEEIAEVQKCPLGTVKSRLHQGLAALERKLGKSGSSMTSTDAIER